MKAISIGEYYWLLESGHNLRQVKVIKKSGNLCTVKFMDYGVGGIRISENRLLTDEEAQEIIEREKAKKRKNPYDYMH